MIMMMRKTWKVINLANFTIWLSKEERDKRNLAAK